MQAYVLIKAHVGDIQPAIGLDDPLGKAGWNWFLIHGDGSHGIHNPEYIMELLRTSILFMTPPPPVAEGPAVGGNKQARLSD